MTYMLNHQNMGYHWKYTYDLITHTCTACNWLSKDKHTTIKDSNGWTPTWNTHIKECRQVPCHRTPVCIGFQPVPVKCTLHSAPILKAYLSELIGTPAASPSPPTNDNSHHSWPKQQFILHLGANLAASSYFRELLCLLTACYIMFKGVGYLVIFLCYGLDLGCKMHWAQVGC